VFDGALSRGKHRTVGGGLPAMNDDAIFLTFRVGCIAGKPPPTVFVRCQTALCQTQKSISQPCVRCASAQRVRHQS
ncbi:hypothetical protein, partial [Pseudomonas viridiflava]|uniref:hypothetical protein n=1 Tax=Pseudomonas viridiflava TaxID=33069 RepID=UPI000F021C5F